MQGMAAAAEGQRRHRSDRALRNAGPGRGCGRSHRVGVYFRQHLRRGHVRHEYRRTRSADAGRPRAGRVWRRPGRTGLMAAGRAAAGLAVVGQEAAWWRGTGRRIRRFRRRRGRGGPMVLGRGGRFDINRPHGSVYYSVADSALDAAPYALTDSPVEKAAYMRQRFGASLGGPLNIPGIYKGGSKTFFFVNYNGSRGDSPFTAFSTVPTAGRTQRRFFRRGRSADQSRHRAANSRKQFSECGTDD